MRTLAVGQLLLQALRRRLRVAAPPRQLLALALQLRALLRRASHVVVPRLLQRLHLRREVRYIPRVASLQVVALCREERVARAPAGDLVHAHLVLCLHARLEVVRGVRRRDLQLQLTLDEGLDAADQAPLHLRAVLPHRLRQLGGCPLLLCIVGPEATQVLQDHRDPRLRRMQLLVQRALQLTALRIGGLLHRGDLLAGLPLLALILERLAPLRVLQPLLGRQAVLRQRGILLGEAPGLVLCAPGGFGGLVHRVHELAVRLRLLHQLVLQALVPFLRVLHRAPQGFIAAASSAEAGATAL
mmetsp:Transcript_46015/g.119037  ORF Transcript_46015/g.119037 Transcript_46015/m.119037 type:complete len:300 (+) Transcript_46015:207-1106(+)